MKDFPPAKWKLGKILSNPVRNLVLLTFLSPSPHISNPREGARAVPAPGSVFAFGFQASPAPGVCTGTKRHTLSCFELAQVTCLLEAFAVTSSSEATEFYMAYPWPH